MAFSVEQSNKFHMVRRIAKLVAPDFRLFSTASLQPGECVLDLKAKTIEVAEGTEEMQAIAAVLFQLGHLKLKDRSEYAEHFGAESTLSEERLISELVRQGYQADKEAAKWAIQLLENTWNISSMAAQHLVQEYQWTKSEWRSYYLSDLK